MGNTCCSAKQPDPRPDSDELLPDVANLWVFINPRKNIQKYGFLCIKNSSKWRIGFINNEFTIYDIQQDVSAKASVTDVSDDGFTLTATFDYVVRQSVYATPTSVRPRTLSFAFYLKDNIQHNLQTYGWRTKVGIYEKEHLLEYCGLV
jgi:hypothetical protein